MRGEARITVAAPADRVWDMVADVTRMHEWSPETYRTRWVGGATGPEVGARFIGWNKRGPLRWATRPKVTESERGRVFAFDTGTTAWRYDFTEKAGVTEVVESFETREWPGYDVVLTVTRRRQMLESGMRQTLQRLKTSAEATLEDMG